MQSALDRKSVRFILGLGIALCLIIQTNTGMCSEQDPTDENPTVDPNVTKSQSSFDIGPDREYVLIVKVRPEYPSRAMKRGIEGSVTVEFSVTEWGIVEDPVVVASKPPGIFDRTAIEAASKFKFRPTVVDGSFVRTDEVQHEFVFQLEDESFETVQDSVLDSGSGAFSDDGEYLPVVKVRPKYPSRAMERGIEGSVTVEFTVTEEGFVEDPVVVESDPPGIFDRAAIQAASKFKYRPKLVDGSPIRVENVKNRFEFEIED